MDIKLKFFVKKETVKNKISSYEGVLNLVIDGNIIGSWAAMSGKYGNGAMPYGEYTVFQPTQLKEKEEYNPFKKEVFPWKCDLKPRFQTGRSELCLHPDGGVYGSLGCLVIEERDISLFFILKCIFLGTDRVLLIVDKSKKESKAGVS